MKLFVLAVLAALTVGCANTSEFYKGAANGVPCNEQYVHPAFVDRCEYDTGLHTNG